MNELLNSLSSSVILFFFFSFSFSLEERAALFLGTYTHFFQSSKSCSVS